MKIYKDICVLGSEIPAMVAASILQRKGARVHFLDHHKYTQFDPSMCEFLSGIFVKPLMQRLGFHPVDIQKLYPLDIPIQLVCDTKRLNFYKDTQKLQKELKREKVSLDLIALLQKNNSKTCPVLQKLYQRELRLSSGKSWFKKTLVHQIRDSEYFDRVQNVSLPRLIQNYGIDPAYEHFIKALELTFSYYFSEEITPSRFFHMMHLLKEDSYYSLLGLSGLKQKLKKKLIEKGATFDQFESIEKLHYGRGRIHGMDLKGSSSDHLEFSNLLIAGDPTGFIGFDQNSRKLKSLAKNQKLKKVGRKIYFLFKIHKTDLPSGIRTQGIIFNDDIKVTKAEQRKWPRMIRYLIHMPNTKAANVQSYLDALEKDHALLAVTYFASYEKDLSQRQIQEEVFSMLQKLIPFLTLDNVTLLHRFSPSTENVAGDFRQGFLYAPIQSSETDLEGNPMETDFKNVWLANESHFPSLGLDGQILAGDQLALALS